MIITAGNDIWIKVTFHDDAIIAKVISSDSSGVEIQVSNAALLAKGGLHLNATGKTFSHLSSTIPLSSFRSPR